MDFFEKCMTAGLVSLLVGTVYLGYRKHGEFTEVCEQAGGTVVFDGRQSQCLGVRSPFVK